MASDEKTIQHFKIKKGLDIPIAGAPSEEISDKTGVSRVALVGPDYVGMKPTMKVQVGDHVKRGQLLFTDKKREGVNYTSPAAGKVIEINRGARRAFESIVIEVDKTEDDVAFSVPPVDKIGASSAEEIKKPLVESGVWNALRTRPFGKVADPLGPLPSAIFVTAMETDPLSGSVDAIMKGQEADFETGLRALSQLTDGPLWLCESPENTPMPGVGKAKVAHFSGKHPAGLPGTHIHFLHPVSLDRFVGYIHFQDVIHWGKFFRTGKVPVERIISLAGPHVNNPRLIRTRLGASLDEIVSGEIQEDSRVVSGSLLSGRTASGAFAYLGRYHNHVSVIREGGEREFLGWHMPGFNKFSMLRVFVSSLIPGKKYKMDSRVHGSKRAVIPVGVYEKVMPLDILATPLLKALMMKDSDLASDLGALELEEEDIALCTFVCPGKNEYEPALREILTIIEKEG